MKTIILVIFLALANVASAVNLTVINIDTVPANFPIASGFIVLQPSATVVIPVTDDLKTQMDGITSGDLSVTSDSLFVIRDASNLETGYIAETSVQNYASSLLHGFAMGWMWFGWGWIYRLVHKPVGINTEG